MTSTPEANQYRSRLSAKMRRSSKAKERGRHQKIDNDNKKKNSSGNGGGGGDDGSGKKDSEALTPEQPRPVDEMAWSFYDAEADERASNDGTVERLKKEVEEARALLDGVIARQGEMEAAGSSSSSSNGVASSSGVSSNTDPNETKLPEDTFSFLLTSRLISIPFWTAALVLLLKTSIFLLLLFSRWDPDRDENKLGLPAAVSAEVSFAQFFALFVCVVTQDDLLTSIVLFVEGYREGIGSTFEHATQTKWCLAVASLSIQGCLGLAVTFILIIQSSDVIGLLLNFTVIEFVSLLDNVVFFLSSLGFFGPPNKEQTALISRTSYIVQRRTSYLFQFGFAAIIFLAEFTTWSVFISRQRRGDFLPQNIVVQIADDRLAQYSGKYAIEGETWVSSPFETKRAKYVDSQGSGATFAYCEDLQAWTFSVSGMGPCRDVAAVSVKTDTFDITTLMSGTWSVNQAIVPTDDEATIAIKTTFLNTNAGLEDSFVIKPAFLLPAGCNNNFDCGGDTGGGRCVQDACQCDDGFYGVQCRFSEKATCGSLTVDEWNHGSRAFSSTYHLLEDNESPVLYTGHPMYFNETSEELILFAGLRWALVHYPTAIPGLEDVSSDGLATFFSNDMDTETTPILQNARFVTMPVPVGSVVDGTTPGDLSWIKARDMSSRVGNLENSIQASFRCATCSDVTNPCENGNTCRSNGKCACTNGASGSFCQVLPLGNGHCDAYFNTPTYGFDGGDCCAATCFNTDEFSCGSVSIGSVTVPNVGYPSCIDTRLACPTNSTGCWRERSLRIDRLSASIDTQVLLSDSGLILIEGSPDLDAVRVFDQVDSRWQQRGLTLEGGRASQYGKTLAISTLPGSVVGRRTGMVEVLLAVGLHGPGKPSVRVHLWEATGNQWRRVGDDIQLCTTSTTPGCGLKSLDIARGMTRVTLAAVQTDGTVPVFQCNLSDTGEGEVWQSVGQEQALLVSLSSDGKVLAMATEQDYSVKIIGQEAPFVAEPFSELFADYGEEFPKLGACSFGNLSIQSIKIVDSPIDFPGDIRFVKVFFSCETGLVFAALVAYSFSDDGGLQFSEPFYHDWDDGTAVTELFFDEQYKDGTLQITSLGAVLKERQEAESTFLNAHHRPDTPFAKPQLVASAYSLSNEDVSYSVSADGLVLAVAEKEGIEVFEASPICPLNETDIRFSMLLDEFPASISWVVESVQSIGGLLFSRQTVGICDHCYDDNERFSRAVIAENLCVDNSETMCIRVTVSSSRELKGSEVPYIAFLPDDYQISSEDSRAQVIARENQYHEDCRVQESLMCEEGMSLFALALNFDFYPEDISWTLTSSRVGGPMPLASGGDYTADVYKPGSTHIFQECVPSNERLIFTFFVSNGLSSRNGYSIYINWELRASRTGDFVGSDEVIFSS